MSEGLDLFNTFTSRLVVFGLVIFGLAILMCFVEKIEQNLGCFAANLALLFALVVVLCIWYRDLKRG